MAQDFLSELKEKTLSSDDFVEETKKMIDDNLKNNICTNIEILKEEILEKSSLGEFKIVNNKKSICGQFTIYVAGSAEFCQKNGHFPIFEEDQVEKIENANLSSYIYKLYPYVKRTYSYGKTYSYLLGQHLTIGSCSPNKRSFWHRLTSKNTNWTANFHLSENTIHYIKELNNALKQEGIILTSVILSLKAGFRHPIIQNPIKYFSQEVSIEDLEKRHIFEFTLPTRDSFDEGKLHLFSSTEKIGLNYYIPVE